MSFLSQSHGSRQTNIFISLFNWMLMGAGKLIKSLTITEMGVVTSAKTGVEKYGSRKRNCARKKTTWELTLQTHHREYSQWESAPTSPPIPPSRPLLIYYMMTNIKLTKLFLHLI
jgi:hypothetical protein